jgi:hypothetical protein
MRGREREGLIFANGCRAGRYLDGWRYRLGPGGRRRQDGRRHGYGPWRRRSQAARGHGATGTVDHNLENTPESYLLNPNQGDFHLTATASDALERGIAVPEAGQDLDGEPHNKGVPDIGADER